MRTGLNQISPQITNPQSNPLGTPCLSLLLFHFLLSYIACSLWCTYSSYLPSGQQSYILCAVMKMYRSFHKLTAALRMLHCSHLQVYLYKYNPEK